MSEKFITCNYQGRLGNLMFEIAATLAAGWNNGLTPTFPWKHHGYYDDILAFKEYLLPVIGQFHRHDQNIRFEEYQEPHDLAYKPIVVSENTRLYGYFTSSKYFDKYREKIIELFIGMHREEVQRIYNNIAEKANGKKIVSVHVRRQDYVKDYNAALPVEYYEQAAANFDNDTVYAVFSDEPVWCASNLPFMPLKIIMTAHKDYMDLQLMGKFDAHIMANSTFSAMGVILGDPQKNKTVYAPKNWWPTHFNPDIYEQHWKLI